jgi:hypothetical protein
VAQAVIRTFNGENVFTKRWDGCGFNNVVFDNQAYDLPASFSKVIFAFDARTSGEFPGEVTGTLTRKG